MVNVCVHMAAMETVKYLDSLFSDIAQRCRRGDRILMTKIMRLGGPGGDWRWAIKGALTGGEG